MLNLSHTAILFFILLFQNTVPSFEPGTYSGELVFLRHTHQIELKLKKNGTYKSREKLTSINSWTDKGSWQTKEDTLILSTSRFKSNRDKVKINCSTSSDTNHERCEERYFYISEGKLYYTKENGRYSKELIRE